MQYVTMGKSMNLVHNKLLSWNLGIFLNIYQFTIQNFKTFWGIVMKSVQIKVLINLEIVAKIGEGEVGGRGITFFY